MYTSKNKVDLNEKKIYIQTAHHIFYAQESVIWESLNENLVRINENIAQYSQYNMKFSVTSMVEYYIPYTKTIPHDIHARFVSQVEVEYKYEQKKIYWSKTNEQLKIKQKIYYELNVQNYI